MVNKSRSGHGAARTCKLEAQTFNDYSKPRECNPHLSYSYPVSGFTLGDLKWRYFAARSLPTGSLRRCDFPVSCQTVSSGVATVL